MYESWDCWESRAVQHAEPAEGCVPLCGAQAIASMGSHAVGKCKMLPICLLRDKADLALLCILNLIAKEKTRPNSTKHRVQKVSCSALWIVLGFGTERWKRAGTGNLDLDLFYFSFFNFIRQRTNIGRSGKMRSHLLAGILLQVWVTLTLSARSTYLYVRNSLLS